MMKQRLGIARKLVPSNKMTIAWPYIRTLEIGFGIAWLYTSFAFTYIRNTVDGTERIVHCKKTYIYIEKYLIKIL